MTPVLVALIWAAIAALFVVRLDRFAHRWLDQHLPAAPVDVPPIPDDLRALVVGEDAGSPEATKLAQQSVEDAIKDAYRRHKDWNLVRRAMGIGEVDSK